MIRAQMIARNVTDCTSRVYVLVVCRGKSRVFEAGLMIVMQCSCWFFPPARIHLSSLLQSSTQIRERGTPGKRGGSGGRGCNNKTFKSILKQTGSQWREDSTGVSWSYYCWKMSCHVLCYPQTIIITLHLHTQNYSSLTDRH